MRDNARLPNALIKRVEAHSTSPELSTQHDIYHTRISLSAHTHSRLFFSLNPIWRRARKINPATCAHVDARPSYESKVCLSHAQRASERTAFMQKKHTSKCMAHRAHLYICTYVRVHNNANKHSSAQRVIF